MDLKKIWAKIKYEVSIFSILLLQALLTAYADGWQIKEHFFTFYLPDYSLGLIPRALVGSFISLFKKQLTESWLTGFTWTSNVLLFLFIAILLGRVLRKASEDLKLPIYVALALFLFTDYSVKAFAKNLGLHDVFMALLVLVCILSLKNRYAKWLLPLLCFLGMAIHYGFLFQFFPFIFVMILFEASKSKIKLGFSLLALVTSLVSILSSAYFILIAPSHTKVAAEQALDYLEGKAIDFKFWRLFAGGIYFNYNQYTSESVENFGELFSYLRLHTVETFSWLEFLTIIFFLLPLLFIFFALWKSCITYSKDKLQKIAFFLCFLLPVPLIPWFFWTTDHPRFLSEIILCQFAVFFYLVYEKNEAFGQGLSRLAEQFKRYPVFWAPILILPLMSFYFK